MEDDRWPAHASVGAFLWVGGTFASSWMTLAVLKAFALHGAQANIGWGALGLVLIQPPLTLAVLVGAALLWFTAPRSVNVPAPQIGAELGPYRATPPSPPATRRPRSNRRWLLLAGLLWSCIAYAGLLFDNAAC